jgi:lactoylglutathione lyase
MIINHLDLQVSDISASRRFFETYFGLVCSFERPGAIVLMEDESGFCFGLSNLHSLPPPVYPPDFHIGFILTEERQVREIYQRVKADGIAIHFDLTTAAKNLFFQCLAPDGIPVEVRSPLQDH